MSERPKPCPFCGGRTVTAADKLNLGLRCMECQTCGARGPRYLDGPPERQWDQRISDSSETRDRLAETAAELSDLAEAIRELSMP